MCTVQNVQRKVLALNELMPESQQMRNSRHVCVRSLFSTVQQCQLCIYISVHCYNVQAQYNVMYYSQMSTGVVCCHSQRHSSLVILRSTRLQFCVRCVWLFIVVYVLRLASHSNMPATKCCTTNTTKRQRS